MIHRLLSVFVLASAGMITNAQDFTSYFTGNSEDSVAQPSGGICLMGGATEHDQAMRWFLERAGGGDVLVLRASGSDGYNDYLFTDLGISVNSVETIVFHTALAATSPVIADRIQKAEAIWLAGGDQWDYVSYWRNSPVDSLINQAIWERNIVIGGTSAGMAVLGGVYFSAQSGSILSSEAISNPYHPALKIDSSRFFQLPFLGEVITDTHFDNPDRKGRFVAFLARAAVDWGLSLTGIACEEYTAVCIDEQGIARVFGDQPQYNDNAWIVKANCQIQPNHPETCLAGQPLTWFHDSIALSAVRIPGTPIGQHGYDLVNQNSISGGAWMNWWAKNGQFYEQAGTEPDCFAGFSPEANPGRPVDISIQHQGKGVFLISNPNTFPLQKIRISDLAGKVLWDAALIPTKAELELIWPGKPIPGIYLFEIISSSGIFPKKLYIGPF